MPHPATPLAGLVNVTSPPVPTVPIDDVDVALLRLLAKDARLSQRSLARALGKSAPAIGERIARLQSLGVIQRYSVVVEWAAVGYPIVVYLAITAAQGSDLGSVMTEVSRLPEVEEVTIVTGELDMLARLRIRDYAHLRLVLLERIWQIPGVQRTETYISIADGPRKDFTSELLEQLSRTGRSGSMDVTARQPADP